jgi:hypothetical protein
MTLQEGTTTLSGEVTDASTGDGLTGAKITTDTNVVTATENGNYITEVTADTPNVTVTADEFGYTAESQTVSNDGVATADFALSPEVAVDPVVGQPTFTAFQSNFSIVADVRRSTRSNWSTRPGLARPTSACRSPVTPRRSASH